MATKAVKKKTSKQQIEFLQTENSLYNEKIRILNDTIDTMKTQITELREARDALERQLADRPKNGREWVLRKLGL